MREPIYRRPAPRDEEPTPTGRTFVDDLLVASYALAVSTPVLLALTSVCWVAMQWGPLAVPVGGGWALYGVGGIFYAGKTNHERGQPWRTLRVTWWLFTSLIMGVRAVWCWARTTSNPWKDGRS